jgi:hypothetical protein
LHTLFWPLGELPKQQASHASMEAGVMQTVPDGKQHLVPGDDGDGPQTCGLGQTWPQAWQFWLVPSGAPPGHDAVPVHMNHPGVFWLLPKQQELQPSSEIGFLHTVPAGKQHLVPGDDGAVPHTCGLGQTLPQAWQF